MRISDYHSYYPFTQAAAEQVRKTGYSLESLLEETCFQSVRCRAAERAQGAISGSIPERQPDTDAEHFVELLSYPLARVIISCVGDELLLRRYAIAEAKLAYRRMQKETGELITLANDLGMHPQGSSPWKLHFTEFILAAHRMHSPKWKLVNRDLREGYLTVTNEELKRLLEEAAKDKVLTGLPLNVDGRACTRLKDYLYPLRSGLDAVKSRKRADLGKIEESAFPPCIRKMLSEVSTGTNLAHSARFALVSFLIHINMTVDEIITLFNTSPDFEEERTRYQVEHIAGASGTKYKPPSCASMITYDNCPGEDELCKRIRHPLSYYENRIESSKPLKPSEGRR